MLFVCYDKLSNEKCQQCFESKDTVVSVRFEDGYKAKICTACLWRRVDKMKAEQAPTIRTNQKTA